MDGVLCDFDRAFKEHPDKEKYAGKRDMVPDIFKDLKPMPGAIEAFEKLWDIFDVYILSTPPWDQPDGWLHKRDWIVKHIPKAKKRLILSHHKNLNRGDYLIDDSNLRGQSGFEGRWIHFGTPDFPNWESVLLYFKSELKEDTDQIEDHGKNKVVDEQFNEKLRDVVKDISKLADGNVDANDPLSQLPEEEVDLYNMEVARMNEMMEQLDEELNGLRKLSKTINKKS